MVMMNAAKIEKEMTVGAELVFLMVLLAASIGTLMQHNSIRPDASPVYSVYTLAVNQLDAAGRLPMNGALAGEINNAYQFFTHPTQPARLGCGDQAAFVYARLSQIKGWSFEMRYAYGFASPILLPHQWITGHGPNGQTVQIDPWSNTFTETK